MKDGNKTVLVNEKFSSNQAHRKEPINSVAKLLEPHLAKLYITKDELFLILDEAITNAMEHGNLWDATKFVTINAYTNSNHLYIQITDEGSGFSSEYFTKNMSDRNILSTRGRGLYIIKQFCDLSWNKQGNQITLTFNLK